MKATRGERIASAVILAAVFGMGATAGMAGTMPQDSPASGFVWKDGAEVYAKVCAYCHEAKVGPTIRGRGLPPAYITFMVRRGNRAMPAFRAAEIDDESLAKLAEYVSKVAANQ